MAPNEDSRSTCPVDHSARDEWLKTARQNGGDHSRPNGLPSAPSPSTTLDRRNSTERRGPGPVGWKSYLPFQQTQGNSASTAARSSDTNAARDANSTLSTERTISSIPRTDSRGAATCPIDPDSRSSALPRSDPNQSSHISPNAETESPVSSESGNWMYPSESQFFSAMKRKGHAASSTDMSVVVPIHNAVNERAWSQILEWENPYLASCGGPRLRSFSGDSKKLTPKARILSLLGYQRPFDRHDWVVDRCGKRVDYVIDFYSGKGGQGKISFYLDVRPKLNSWEGLKMRVLRGIGIVY